MTTFFEASQVRLVLKMKLSNYSWYKGCSVVAAEEGYAVLIGVTHINSSIQKVIPRVCSGVTVKAEVEK
jgi:hypothetical protein